jgi:hypothetical protein
MGMILSISKKSRLSTWQFFVGRVAECEMSALFSKRSLKEVQENAGPDYCNNGYCNAYDDKPAAFPVIGKHLIPRYQ